MKTLSRNTEPKPRKWTARPPLGNGFSLLEILVAMAVFLIVSAAAFSLFNQQQTAALSQQGQAGLNVAVRNAVGQLQMDLVNAGSGYFQGANIPNWPVGVSIVNHVVASGSSCYDSTTFTYGTNCFDQINVIAVDPNTPPIHVDGSGTTCSSTTSSILFGDPAQGLTASQTASYFHSGDEVLVVNASGSLFDAVVLTRDGQAAGNKVQLQHNPTGANGTNNGSDDPLSITTNYNNKLGTNFCTSDWILRLSPITYQVCNGPGSPTPCDQGPTSPDIQDPKLERVVGGVGSVVMEQVIGFKVGATIWNGANQVVSTQYIYDASQYNVSNPTPPPYDSAYDFTLVRSVRISLIGRTSPSTNPAYTFRNSFDQGPYQVQGMSVVVNPRNMSMNDTD